jgi:hypothetical protein
VLEFAEHVVLNARRMQKVLFPEGLAYDGKAFRTPVTCLFVGDSAGAEVFSLRT